MTTAPRPEPTEVDPQFCQDAGEATAPRPSPVGRLDDVRCSVQALLRGDSPMATAPPARRWLLVEQPGPWGRDALLESRFDHRVASRLAARARELGMRIQMVRRPGERLADSGRRWAVADTTPGQETVRWSTRDSDAELLDRPWDGSVGEPTQVPTYLVCTHGAHDVCCAVRGRPLARALPTGGVPADVWETSHLGGDRFAANVVVLPWGFVYGQVPEDGEQLLAAHAAGQVALPWLRGRAGVAPAAQAAQHHARSELGLLGVHELATRRVRALEAPAGVERFEVTLAGPAGDVVVTVESRLSAEAHRLTCAAAQPGRWRTWHPLSLQAT
ncbi:sucrase ferredoxin [Modestobacter italicus]|uniref:sucrase ferredoxin n=1 Tax=Modestobacter italicus (strain DSM 44449 / CECT 9708 / BC 501) TaxID=2732864 RepID=UPI0027E0EFDF|nr:sucrase ferredoxin [Modestobacter italicus]